MVLQRLFHYGFGCAVSVIVCILGCIFLVLSEGHCLFCVMALIHNGQLTGVLLGTVNCTMPSLDDAA